MPEDYSTPPGQVRLLVNDTEQPGIFDDAHIAGFLTICGGHVLLAAAMALDAMASDESLLSKKIRTQDLQTDGPAVAESLRAHAKALRQQAATEAATAEDAPAFEIVEAPYGGYRGRPELTELAW